MLHDRGEWWVAERQTTSVRRSIPRPFAHPRGLHQRPATAPTSYYPQLTTALLSGSDRQIVMRAHGGLDGAAERGDSLVCVVVRARQRHAAGIRDECEAMQIGRAVLRLDGECVERFERHRARAAAQQANTRPGHATFARVEGEHAPLVESEEQ